MKSGSLTFKIILNLKYKPQFNALICTDYMGDAEQNNFGVATVTTLFFNNGR
jgi:hypothetical protein